jgi:Rps23 Pro-64 3,4-dihydroxylase Tpa1-like proline 4-hydroxylase
MKLFENSINEIVKEEYDILLNNIKIDKEYLNTIENENITQFFGDWVDNIDTIKTQFLNAKPYENVVIDNFLNNEYAEIIYNEFPDNYDEWHKYCNPIEVKYTYDNINNLGTSIKKFFYYLSSVKITQIISEITDIPELEYDEYLHGAGVHAYPRYGRLNIHLDYEKHPITGKERRINVIFFLSKDWDNSWNGANELWNDDATKCITKTNVKFNSAIIFKTNDISWHGVPEIIKCPTNIVRKSLAYYYVSKITTTNKKENEYRKKAKFIKRPQDKYNEHVEKLYKIRPNRRITNKDMIEIMPEWKIDM